MSKFCKTCSSLLDIKLFSAHGDRRHKNFCKFCCVYSELELKNDKHTLFDVTISKNAPDYFINVNYVFDNTLERILLSCSKCKSTQETRQETTQETRQEHILFEYNPDKLDVYIMCTRCKSIKQYNTQYTSEDFDKGSEYFKSLIKKLEQSVKSKEEDDEIDEKDEKDEPNVETEDDNESNINIEEDNELEDDNGDGDGDGDGI